MKIVEMRVTPVAMADPPLFSSYGLHAPYALRTIIELVSEDGIAGIGETYGGERVLKHLEQAKSVVTGRSAYDLARLETELGLHFDNAKPFSSVEAASGIEATQTFILPGEDSDDIAMRMYIAIEVAGLDLFF